MPVLNVHSSANHKIKFIREANDRVVSLHSGDIGSNFDMVRCGSKSVVFSSSLVNIC